MKEKIRIRCPVCGMLPEMERVKKKPVFPVEVYRQRFGGRVESKPVSQPEELMKPRRGRPRKLKRPRGFMEYTKLDDPNLINEAKRLFLEHIERAKAEGIL